jgi:hypothetical protein
MVLNASTKRLKGLSMALEIQTAGPGVGDNTGWRYEVDKLLR